MMSAHSPNVNSLSPCVDRCAIDQTGHYCIGCCRSLEEIAGWGLASDEERRAIIEKLPERRGRLQG
jgi:uncharacterized protein